jgi:thiamine-monophosphate kinase
VSERPEPPRTAGEIDEFELIDRLVGRLGPSRADMIVGVGDDVAVFQCTADRLLLATCDSQVAGTHFSPESCDPFRLGRKAAAINLSDIASAGGKPQHFLSSLVIPPALQVSFLEALYDGLAAEAGRWDVDVAGGNVSRGESLVVDLTLLGEVAPAELLRRDGAAAGDLVLVTGELGAAAAGLRLTRDGTLKVPREVRADALRAFETPTPRLGEGRALAREGGVSAMIDISDGLAADLWHLCDAGDVGVRLLAPQIPVAESAREVARASGADALEWALAGGEDYELLFTAPAARANALIDAVRIATSTPVTVIGKVVAAGQGRNLVTDDGVARPLVKGGWRHF